MGHIAEIKARCKWNQAGHTRLEKGRAYRLHVRGTWKDAFIETDARGYGSTSSKVPWLLRPLLRLAESWRRIPEADWFSLIGTVDKDLGTAMDIGGMLKDLDNGTGAVITPGKTGHLYCFANDLPFMYWNNSGAILLSITPVEA